MSTLRIYLFGMMRVTRDDTTEAKLTPQQEMLLAYLLIHRRHPLSREVVAGLFWGEYSQEQARRAFNTALWRLRGAIGEGSRGQNACLLTAPPGRVGIEPDNPHWVDLYAFEDTVEMALKQPPQALGPQQIADLHDALQLYRGELLEGQYADWVLPERERLENLWIRGEKQLMAAARLAGRTAESLACAQKILAVNPLHEEVHREVMRLYAESGQRALAARQYAVCREALHRQLGIRPAVETEQLYARIVGEADGDGNHIVDDEELNLEQVFERLRMAIDTVDGARDQLLHSLEFIKGMVKQ